MVFMIQIFPALGIYNFSVYFGVEKLLPEFISELKGANDRSYFMPVPYWFNVNTKFLSYGFYSCSTVEAGTLLVAMNSCTNTQKNTICLIQE